MTPLPLTIAYLLSPKIINSCHQISPVQEEACFGVDMMHHATQVSLIIEV